MKFYLLFPVALVLLAPIWATACGVQPTDIPPAEEAVTAQAGQATNDEGLATAEERVDPSTPTSEVQTEEANVSPLPTPTATQAEPPEEAKPAVRLAQEDLAERLGLAPEAIRLVSAEAVEWPDASLGCPQPGMMYAQVITPGFRVVLEAEGEQYWYHTDQGRFAVLCEAESGTSGASSEDTPPGEIATFEPHDPFLNEMVAKAKEDLANRLSVEMDRINLLEVRQVTWHDASLGCPQPGMAYAQVLQEGLLIRLGLGKDIYFYHSGETGDPFLCEGTVQIVPKITPKVDEFVPPPDSEID